MFENNEVVQSLRSATLCSNPLQWRCICIRLSRHIDSYPCCFLVWRISPNVTHTHGRAPAVGALSWHLTNTRDGGRITTRVWYRSRSVLTIVNFAGSEMARCTRDTAVHHPEQSHFLIVHQSELLRTVSDNMQQTPASGPRLRFVPQFSTPTITGRKWRQDMFCREIHGLQDSVIHHGKV